MPKITLISFSINKSESHISFELIFMKFDINIKFQKKSD